MNEERMKEEVKTSPRSGGFGSLIFDSSGRLEMRQDFFVSNQFRIPSLTQPTARPACEPRKGEAGGRSTVRRCCHCAASAIRFFLQTDRRVQPPARLPHKIVKFPNASPKQVTKASS